jgi:hypothetical protein
MILIICSETDGVTIINIENPRNMNIVYKNDSLHVFKLVCKNNICYLYETNLRSVKIINLNELRNGKVVMETDIDHCRASAFGINKDILYIGYAADKNKNIAMYNITNPFKPWKINEWLKNDTAYVIYKKDKVGPFNDVIQHINDTTKIKEIAKSNTDSIGYNIYERDVNGFAFHDSLMYMVSNKIWAEYYKPDPLRIFNVTVPNNIKLIGEYKLPGWGIAITVNCDRIYISDVYEGLRVLDVKDIKKIKELGFYKKKYPFDFLDYKDGYIFATDKVNGFRILKTFGSAQE